MQSHCLYSRSDKKPYCNISQPQDCVINFDRCLDNNKTPIKFQSDWKILALSSLLRDFPLGQHKFIDINVIYQAQISVVHFSLRTNMMDLSIEIGLWNA